MYRREDVKKKKKTSYWKYLLILILVFVLSGIGGAYFANALVDNKPMYSDAEKDGLLVAKDKATVMIMGVDKRNDDVGRSDTLMVATLDPDKNQAALLSIPRDTRVKIKGHGYDKINAAYAYGDRKLSQQTVESLLGIKIDHYIVIDVHGFTKIIDALGGIDIDVEKRMYYEDPWDDDGGLYIDLQPGMQHMDGKTAVTYVRYRDEEGDIGRIRRQQKILSLSDKVKNYIDQHYSEAISLEEIAKAVKANKYYLAHVFKNKTGFSPLHYVSRRRLGEAQNLLINTDMSITQIAATVGYNNSNYFQNIFRRYMGMTPGYYRKKWKS